VYATKLEDKVSKQEQEIAELNQTVGEYEAMDSFWEEYIDLLDEIYQGKINEAVLEERVKRLEEKSFDDKFDKEFYIQLIEDIGIYIEEFESTEWKLSGYINFDEWFEMHYPEVSERIKMYIDLYDLYR